MENERHDAQHAAGPKLRHHVWRLRFVRVPREEDGRQAQREPAVLAKHEDQPRGLTALLRTSSRCVLDT